MSPFGHGPTDPLPAVRSQVPTPAVHAKVNATGLQWSAGKGAGEIRIGQPRGPDAIPCDTRPQLTVLTAKARDH